LLNPYLAREACRAANDWNRDTWLSVDDDRITSVVAIPNGEPLEAAKEIRRVGTHPKIVSVLLATNALGKPLGDPVYEPIFEASAELGLAIAVRPGPAVLAVGGSKTVLEDVTGFAQQGMHYLTSLIVHGVFERHPNLHVVMKEFGFTWLPQVMWKLDEHYELLKLESPWVKRLPSEYIREHVLLSTQPVEESPDDRRGLARLLEAVDGMEDLLCFSSDYPHPTMDEVDFAERQLPVSWLPKVMYQNACRVYGWARPDPVAAAVSPS
jgi:predicted TIM-barrel fold metal-dependent hydrolase